ncbi:tRNA lysidine(34) synthetase TilS [Mucilaginibacter sp. BT774]|uniref:tRNA lysidine(34) synthetase TilS n=1 Tax=Mucilaginibacter sp. BT774 TaxID=3062276 RepID=UPI0026775C80|nr:tRNA lysidine(34) synthetase TilS [Mucilaginibacter sp. BT774]MDO3625590.1 tRNA lysidine(34) synthetase TilS [Mucilaginibacter sp. BT774]
MLPVKNFIDFIEKNALFNRDSNILAAVSGGMDSVVMVHLLKAVGYNFGIAHCNFQLRGDEALSDQQFVKDIAGKLGVPFYTINFDTKKYAAEKKISIQMAARELRYQWFAEVSQQSGYDVIALAHHQNDTIETILLNLTRGTGIAGLHGILPKNGSIVRPLMFLKRDDIQDIVKAENLQYVEDSSNSSAKYARNKIRLEVIPKLKELNPALEDTFEHNLKHFRGLEVLLEQRLGELKKSIFIFHGGDIHISIDEVKKLHPQFLLFYGLLQGYGFNESTVEDIISSLDKHSGRVFGSPAFMLLLDRDKLILAKRQALSNQSVSINKDQHEVKFNNYRLNILHDDSPLIIKDNPMSVSIDTDLLIYPLTVRYWREGDHFHPLGMKTRQKLSDFFVHQKVPLHEKSQIPLLVNGNEEIIWVGGYRPDERYKVTAKTKKVTIFGLFKL